jgi:YegS/Rv2252/BmrU family lipid kinase
MVPERTTVFIINPNSANGATGKAWPHIEARARDRLGGFDVRVTEAPGHATQLTRQAVMSGVDLVVCVGGDGTLNEVVNGLMDEAGPMDPRVRLGYIPRGTGGDFVRSIPIPKDADAAIQCLVSGRTRPIDLGRFTFRDHEGRESRRYFHNVLSFGLGGEVDERVNRTTKMFGGFVSFLWATLVSILCYEKKRVNLTVDGHPHQEMTAWNVAVANGQYHGGGMLVAPGAEMDSGVFQITVIEDLRVAEVFWYLPKLYNGKIYEVKKVARLAGKRIIAHSPDRVLLDVDGEQPGQLPVEIELVPAALSIVC